MNMAATAQSNVRVCWIRKRDLKRHGAAENWRKDVSLQARGQVEQAYRKEMWLFCCQRLISRLVDEVEVASWGIVARR